MDDDDDFFVLDRKGSDQQLKEMVQQAKVIKKKVKKQKQQKKQQKRHSDILESKENTRDILKTLTTARTPSLSNGSPSNIDKGIIPQSEAVSNIMKEIQEVEREDLMTRQKLQNKFKKTGNALKRSILIENNKEKQDDDILRIKRKFNKVSSQIKQTVLNSSTKLVSLQEEKGRVYQFKIISKLPGTEGFEVKVNITGDKKFKKLILACLKHLAGKYHIEEKNRLAYLVVNVLLLYKSKIKILDYMMPSYLGLPAPLVTGEKTFATVYIMTKEQANNLDQEAEAISSVMLNDNEDDNSNDAQETSDYEAEIFDGEEIEDVNDADADNDDYFTIVLKDKDNEKLEIKVSKDTSLRKVVDHYVKKKGLTASPKIDLIFDDEKLGLDLTVGDTELEDEYSVDVVVH